MPKNTSKMAIFVCKNWSYLTLEGPGRQTSPNFGQAKHGQNGPAATFCQQGICCPICKHHFTRWTHPDISLRLRAGGRRVKKFSFSRICVSARDFFCRPAADSILMPPTFPIASLNRYILNFSGVPQKLTWCQQFGLQIFPM